MNASPLLDLGGFRQARDRVGPHLHRTPLLSWRTLGDKLGVPVHLKCENLQKTGSFKVRGALNAMTRLTAEQRERGVITISAGNHAQAVAWAARQAGVEAVVVMPERASRTKVTATRGYGASVVLHGDAAQAFQEARRLAAAQGLTFLHPFDDEGVIAGHGSTGLELAEDLPDGATVVVPIGGGGQISGIAGALHAVDGSRFTVHGVEPEGASAMRQSLDGGAPVHLPSVDTIADGLAPPMAGTLNFEYVRRCVEDVVLVSDTEILAAMALLLRRAKILAEPSGAAGVAALMNDRINVQGGRPVVVVISGGNVDDDLIMRCLREADPWP